MDEKAIRGIPWTLLSYASTKLIYVVTTVVLARLLSPSDFGIVALASVVTGLVGLFSGLGLGAALVLRRDLNHVVLGTVLTLLLATGALFGAIVAAASPLVATLLGEPRVAGVLAALGLVVFFSGFIWFYESLLQRALEFRKRFISLLIQTVTYSAVATTLAVLGAGVWSIVAGQVAALATYGAALLWLAPYRVRLAFDRRAAGEALGAGRGFIAQGAAAFLQGNIDYLVVGRVLGASNLGFYSMAYRQAELPHWAIADPVAKVTFPGFAQMRHRGEDVTRSYISTLRLVALATFPIGVVFSAAAHPFTETFFGEKWLPMVGPLSVLGIWAAIGPLESTVAWLLNSMGKATALAWVSITGLFVLFPGVLWAASAGSITAVAWAVLLQMLLSLLALLVLAQRQLGLSIARHWHATRTLLVAAAVSWGATRLAVLAGADLPAAIVLVAAGAACLVTYGCVIAILEPELLQDARRQLRRSLRRTPPPASAAPDVDPIRS